VGGWLQNALLDTVIIDRFKAPDPVGIDPPLVSRDQDRGAYRGFLLRYPQAPENIAHKLFQKVKIQIDYIFMVRHPQQLPSWSKKIGLV
jgi:hypothetical protein